MDTDFITPHADRAMFCKLWNIPESFLIVLYSGNMGKKQDLNMVLEAAYKFQVMDNVLFVMVGTGVALDGLKKRAAQLKLDNMRFFPLQPYNRLPNLMTFADVHLVLQRKGIEGAMFPSKLVTILSAGGTALVTAQRDTELDILCDNYPGICQRIEPGNAEALFDALKKMLESIDVDSRSYNNAAREYAEIHLSKNKILNSYLDYLIFISG
ncbi:hypothetical protein ES705_29862 [subsurface metagenome]